MGGYFDEASAQMRNGDVAAARFALHVPPSTVARSAVCRPDFHSKISGIEPRLAGRWLFVRRELEVRSLQINRSAAFRAALMAGGAGLAIAGSPALAQAGGQVDTNEPVQCTPGVDADCAQVTDETTQAAGIVVTGSRIVRRDYEFEQPDRHCGPGLAQPVLDLGAREPTSTSCRSSRRPRPRLRVAIFSRPRPTPRVRPPFRLRGIGSNRSLVLIDGRRATPSNATGVVDITTIPSAAIERVEIISGGASATYGADAVAGVTNFIMKKNFQGLEMDGNVGLNQHGSGLEYTISGIMGADFDDGRGNISIALSTNKREATYQRDYDFYRRNWANPNTSASGFFLPDPGYQPRVHQLAGPVDHLPGRNAGGPGSKYGGVLRFEWKSLHRQHVCDPWWNTFFNGATDGRPYKLMANGTIGANDDYVYNTLPLTRYNMYMRGNYEINDWIGVFGQGIYSHVKTHTLQEPGPIVGGWGVTLDPTVIDRALLPAGVLQVLDARPNPNAPFALQALMPLPRETDTDVNTFNITAGVEGSIPDTDWTFEAFVNHGESATFANQTGIYSLSRLREIITQPNFGAGYTVKGNAPYGGFGASTGTCTSGLNFFAGTDTFSQDCIEAISADLKNNSKVQQSIWEANADRLAVRSTGRPSSGRDRRELPRDELPVPQRHSDYAGPVVPGSGARHLSQRQLERRDQRQGSLRRIGRADPA